MFSRPTCYPAYVKDNHFILRVRAWRMIHRYHNILDSYDVVFTSGLQHRRLWFEGQYPEREFCTCFERGGDFCLWS